jgi:hypothetical protein
MRAAAGGGGGSGAPPAARAPRPAHLVQILVDVHGKVHHVGLLQQRNLALHDILLIVNALVLEELQQREH